MFKNVFSDTNKKGLPFGNGNGSDIKLTISPRSTNHPDRKSWCLNNLITFSSSGENTPSNVAEVYHLWGDLKKPHSFTVPAGTTHVAFASQDLRSYTLITSTGKGQFDAVHWSHGGHSDDSRWTAESNDLKTKWAYNLVDLRTNSKEFCPYSRLPWGVGVSPKEFLIEEFEANLSLYPKKHLPHTQPFTLDLQNKSVTKLVVLSDWWQKRPTSIVVKCGEKVVGNSSFLTRDNNNCGVNGDEVCEYPRNPTSHFVVPINSSLIPKSSNVRLSVIIDGLLDPANEYVIIQGFKWFGTSSEIGRSEEKEEDEECVVLPQRLLEKSQDGAVRLQPPVVPIAVAIPVSGSSGCTAGITASVAAMCTEEKEEQLHYCTECGQGCTPDSTFCSKCGSKLRQKALELN